MAHALAACQYCRRCFYFYQQGFMALLGEEESDQRLSVESGDESHSTSSLSQSPRPPSDRLPARGSVQAASDVVRTHESYAVEDGEGERNFNSSTPTINSSGASISPVGDYIDCRDVVLFSRILRMIDASSNSLRQQLVNDESK